MLKNPFLTDEEHRQILVAWNDTSRVYPTDLCIHEVFEAQASRTPHATAVTCEQIRLTYFQLNQRANQLAHYLRSLYVGPEVTVGIYLEHSVELVIALLAILKAGGAYVPLDIRQPQEHTKLILMEARATVVITQSKFASRIQALSMNTVCIDSDWPQIAHQKECNLPVLTSPANLAFVLFTSGSTGRPKGVLTCHRNLLVRIFLGKRHTNCAR